MRLHRRTWMRCIRRGHEVFEGDASETQLRAYKLAVDLFLEALEPVFEDGHAVAKLRRVHVALPPAREGKQ